MFFRMMLSYFNDFYIKQTQRQLEFNPNKKFVLQLHELLKTPGFFAQLIRHEIKQSDLLLASLRNMTLTDLKTQPELPTVVPSIYRLFSTHHSNEREHKNPLETAVSHRQPDPEDDMLPSMR